MRLLDSQDFCDGAVSPKDCVECNSFGGELVQKYGSSIGPDVELICTGERSSGPGH